MPGLSEVRIEREEEYKLLAGETLAPSLRYSSISMVNIPTQQHKSAHRTRLRSCIYSKAES